MSHNLYTLHTNIEDGSPNNDDISVVLLHSTFWSHVVLSQAIRGLCQCNTCSILYHTHW